jgi:patatin-related protein
MALLTPLTPSSMPDRAVTPASSTHGRSVAAAPPQAQTTELRLAVVCDGGVSLAIYMHGVTKELQHVVAASRAFDQASAGGDPAAIRAGLHQTQTAYFDALMAKSATGGITVTIDTISGTSAGGINGVFLAKGLTHNLSQDPLTAMWMEKGDIGELAHHHLPGMFATLAEVGLKLPWHLKATEWSPLDGNRMAEWLVEALANMDASKSAAVGDSLLPPDHDLDLFVTTTDLRGYDRTVPSPDGGPGDHGRNNRKLFHWNSGAPGPGARFGAADNPGLAFAARCTSSFPGAFAPANLGQFADTIRPKLPKPFDVKAFADDQMAEYGLAGVDPAGASFADGGLLDNSPFDHVIQAIAAKSAQANVDRRILHIDPDPGDWPPIGGESTPTEHPMPGYLSGVKSALGVRSSQSNVSELLDMQQMNDTIAQVGRITADMQDRISDYLNQLVTTNEIVKPDWDKLTSLAGDIHATVPSVVGEWNLSTYERLKVASIGEMLATDLGYVLGYPNDVQQAAFLRAVLANWFDGDGFWTSRSEDDVIKFLNTADMPYRERRLRFLISGVNALYSSAGLDPQTRESLNELKGVAWGLLNDLIAFRASAVTKVLGALTAFINQDALAGARSYVNPDQFAAQHADDIAALVTAYTGVLQGYSSDSARSLWQRFTELTQAWPDLPQWDLIGRYLGFPLWDALIYPIIALSRLPQLSAVQLQRVSPLDAKLLNPTGGAGKPKLRGTAVHHFGGFFDREWRENDYLWGRLDAAELILGILGQHGWTSASHDALSAIVAAESAQLETVKDLLNSLRDQLTSAPIQPAG